MTKVLELEGKIGVKTYCSEANVEVLTLDGEDLFYVIAEGLKENPNLFEEGSFGSCKISIVVEKV